MSDWFVACGPTGRWRLDESLCSNPRRYRLFAIATEGREYPHPGHYRREPVESRTSGSEGGRRKPSRRKLARAPQPDPYSKLATRARGR